MSLQSAPEVAGDDLLGLRLAVCAVQEGGHRAGWWEQPGSAAVCQGDRAGAAHGELALGTADSSVGALFVRQGVWMADNCFFPSFPGRQKMLQAPNYHENSESFLV